MICVILRCTRLEQEKEILHIHKDVVDLCNPVMYTSRARKKIQMYKTECSGFPSSCKLHVNLEEMVVWLPNLLKKNNTGLLQRDQRQRIGSSLESCYCIWLDWAQVDSSVS